MIPRRIRQSRKPTIVVETPRNVTLAEVEEVFRNSKRAFPGRRVAIFTDGWRVRP